MLTDEQRAAFDAWWVTHALCCPDPQCAAIDAYRVGIAQGRKECVKQLQSAATWAKASGLHVTASLLSELAADLLEQQEVTNG